MYIPITTAVLVSMTVAMILLQIVWLRLPPRLRYLLIRASIAIVLLHGMIVATKWNTTSNHLNALINWLAVAGYTLLVLRFSRVSPQWLTIPSAAILLIPLFAASIVFPLARIFEPRANKAVPLTDHLFYEVNAWKNVGGGNAGIDIVVYYRPSFAPFLQHKIQTIPLDDRQCNTNAAVVVLDPSARTVLGRCPRWPDASAGSAGFFDKLLPLPKGVFH
jgi:hypothetical protein